MTDKQSNLDKTLGDIVKRYGEGSIMRLGERPKVDIPSISTGCMSLDLAIGVGGIPVGRTTEIFGAESSGKTTIMQHIAAEAQKSGGVAAYIDMEHALDTNYAERCGVDIEKLLISQPDTGEQALEIAEALARSGDIRLIIVDSVAKLVPRAEVEGEMGNSEMGGRARLMSQGLRKLAPVISRNQVALVFTNQIRNKIGVMYGSPETTPGGLSLPFEASVRIKLRRVNAETDTEHARIHAKIIKNKVAPPFKECEFDILYLSGIDKLSDLLEVALKKEIIKQGGAFYQFKDIEPKWRGKEQVKLAIQSDPKLAEEILKLVKEAK